MIEFKNSHVKDRFDLLHPRAKEIIQEQADFCFAEGVEFVLTETVSTASEDIQLNRVSSGHRECRAWDIRTRNWSLAFVKKFCDYFEKKYRKIGAISHSDLGQRFIVNKSQTAKPHLHCSLSKAYAKTIAWRKKDGMD